MIESRRGRVDTGLTASRSGTREQRREWADQTSMFVEQTQQKGRGQSAWPLPSEEQEKGGQNDPVGVSEVLRANNRRSS